MPAAKKKSPSTAVKKSTAKHQAVKLAARQEKKPSVKEYFYANGKRKTSIAKVRLYRNGSGKITVNDKDFAVVYPQEVQQQVIHSPLKLTNNLKTFDITAKTLGGGKFAQADAMRHGISKALLEYDPSLRLTLKRAGFLTRDSRMKERKKYGLKRARRAPQFSKR